MPSSSRLLAQVQSFLSGAKSALTGSARGTGELVSRAEGAVDEKLGKVPPQRRRTVLLAVAIGLSALLFVFAAISQMEWEPRDPLRAPEREDGVAQWGLIPPEELFLPDEPDIVPGVMLGRERREEWGIGDAEPWWQNPLADGEEQWRTRIDRMIDEIMENVP